MPSTCDFRRFLHVLMLCALPGVALASIHADFADNGVFGVLVSIWQGIGILGGLAMLTAGILFWRRGMMSAVLACLAIQTLPGVLSRILLWSYQSTGTFPGAGNSGAITLMSLLGGAVTVLQWAALGVALGVTLFRRPAAIDPNLP